MAALFWAAATPMAAFLIHVLIWRVRLPQRHTRAILLVFGATGALALVAQPLLASAQAFHGIPVMTSATEYAMAALFIVAATAAYVITYSALEADSPTLVMIRAIAEAGPDGLPEALFHQRLTEDVLLRPRIADLKRDGFADLREGRVNLTSKGRRFVALFIWQRRILGAGKGG